MIRFKIIIILVDNGEHVKFGFADPNGNFYPFNSTGISNFNLVFVRKFLFKQFIPQLSYDNFDTSYFTYQIKESDEIILEEFIYI
jgi:hypothetical protein